MVYAKSGLNLTSDRNKSTASLIGRLTRSASSYFSFFSILQSLPSVRKEINQENLVPTNNTKSPIILLGIDKLTPAVVEFSCLWAQELLGKECRAFLIGRPFNVARNTK
jgi:hypothetical protein